MPYKKDKNTYGLPLHAPVWPSAFSLSWFLTSFGARYPQECQSYQPSPSPDKAYRTPPRWKRDFFRHRGWLFGNLWYTNGERWIVQMRRRTVARTSLRWAFLLFGVNHFITLFFLLKTQYIPHQAQVCIATTPFSLLTVAIHAQFLCNIRRKNLIC